MSFETRRPRTLAEVSRRVVAGEQPFDMALSEFLDVFYTAPDRRDSAIADAPAPLPPVQDAYLAAVAEHLAKTYGLAVPAWAEHRGLDLPHPFFAGGLEALKAVLQVESPTAFRRRMLFVSRNALSRARATDIVGGAGNQEHETIGRSP